MSARRPYIRPMDGWWKRDPFFVRYMLREVTALFVAAYAIVLLVGLVRLCQGPGAYDAWLLSLQSPLSVVLHCVLFVIFLYHTWSWFRIMPKTMAAIWIGGSKLPPGTITSIGILATVIASVLVVLLALGVKS